MKLEVVWRNPAPPEPSEAKIEATEYDHSGATYTVRTSGATTEFELILCHAA